MTGPPNGLWTVRGVLDAATRLLEGRGVPEPRLDASLLLAHALELERIDIYMQMDRPLDEPERARFRALVKERARRVPVPYLTGRRAFFGLDLAVGRATLIPRPETELLVEAALEVLDARAARAPAAPGALVCEIGTGSGAIAVALAHKAGARVRRLVATDVSRAALEVARRNVDAHALSALVELREGDLLEPLGAMGLAGKVDVLVSNPPYVAADARADLQAEVLAEPPEALFAGPDGLACLRPLIAGARRVLEPGGSLVLEIGHDQGSAVRELAARAGFEEVWVRRDLAGKERVVQARAPRG